MKIPSTFTWLAAAVLTATLAVFTLTNLFSGTWISAPLSPTAAESTLPAPAAAPAPENSANRIQIAFLLDTSSSMDGLIDQAKARLWNILGEILKAERDGQSPAIEVALFEYGNSGLLPQKGYIREVSSLTTNVDNFSEKLFGLKTGGGDEFCGHVILTSTEQLQWDEDANTVKLIYIAGNESFLQGNVSAKDALTKARNKGIVVNTIFCGDPNTPDGKTWRIALTDKDGDFFSINQDEAVVFIPSPYDDAIEEGNLRLNGTYIPVGQQGIALQENQVRQDANAASYGKANLSSRAKYKASANYTNASWDLVDAYSEDKERVMKDKATLPDSLRTLSDEVLTAKIAEMKAERLALQTSIQDLTNKRDAFVAEARKTAAGTEDNTLGSRINASVRKRLIEKKYVIKE
ncbi:vWA domain-containing protein [Neolewinella persica]|uniref:vWA domain-containing protein n=1 Tax=Neolewinella persica TaxID=70998 RepID=UPI0003814B7E|nr:vWA domain-containing protein [Neolewinella persica]